MIVAKARLAMIAIAAVSVVLVAPAAASAATVTGQFVPLPAANGQPAIDYPVEFTGGPGERNDVDVVVAGGDIMFRDAGAPIVAAGECTRIDDNTARCPARNPVDIAGTVKIFLGEGDDRANIAPNVRLGAVLGETGNDVLIGSLLDGGPGDDVVVGTSGPDQLTGGGGRDRVLAVDGRDVIYGSEEDAAADHLDGGNGIDRVSYAATAGRVVVNLSQGRASGRDIGRDTLVGFEDADGGAGNDTLVGNLGFNRLRGFGGNDRLEGGGASDRLDGGDGSDSFGCGAGANDALYFPIAGDVVGNDCESVGLATPTRFDPRPRVRPGGERSWTVPCERRRCRVSISVSVGSGGRTRTIARASDVARARVARPAFRLDARDRALLRRAGNRAHIRVSVGGKPLCDYTMVLR